MTRPSRRARAFTSASLAASCRRRYAVWWIVSGAALRPCSRSTAPGVISDRLRRLTEPPTFSRADARVETRLHTFRGRSRPARSLARGPRAGDGRLLHAGAHGRRTADRERTRLHLLAAGRAGAREDRVTAAADRERDARARRERGAAGAAGNDRQARRA